MFDLRLYSPANFVAGLQVLLARRARLDLPQALAEAQRESPRWGYRLVASALTGVLILYAVFAAVPQAAGPLMQGASDAFSGRQAALGIAAVVAAFALWLALALLRRSWRFYAAVCRLGQAARAAG